MERHVDAFTPNARSQTISGVIRQFDRFFRRAKCHSGEHGTEDFLLRDDRSGMHIAQKCRLVIETARRHGNFRLPAGGAFGDSLLDQAVDAFELNFCNDCADVNGLVER